MTNVSATVEIRAPAENPMVQGSNSSRPRPLPGTPGGSVIDRLVCGRPEVEHDRRQTPRSWTALRHEDTDHVLARVHVQRCAESTVPAEAPGHSGNIVAPGHDRKAEAPATRVPEVFEEG